MDQFDAVETLCLYNELHQAASKALRVLKLREEGTVTHRLDNKETSGLPAQETISGVISS